MPLDQQVNFKTLLCKNRRFGVPRIIRGQFKLEPTQILRITITLADAISEKESFFSKMRKDGHITIPPIAIAALKKYSEIIENQPIEVIVEPA